MRKIVILNPKGGSGKTTLSTNLAAYYATHGTQACLMDADPQGSSARWLSQRPHQRPAIHGIAAYQTSGRLTRSFQLQPPPETERLIVDTPAALEGMHFPDHTRAANAILVPVLPSEIDIHSASRCIADLLLVARVDRRENRLAVVANRVRRNTKTFLSLRRFLESLDIPFVATLQDSQQYIQAFQAGLGIHELKSSAARPDLTEWDRLVEWLEDRPEWLAGPGPQAEAHQRY